jgi:hypothetical protein
MSIPQCDLNAFVTKPVRNRHRRKAHVDQQGNMAVPEVMNSDPLDPCGLSATIHFVMKIALGNRKDPILLFQSVEHFQIILHLFTEKRRHLDRPVAFLRFRRRDYVLAV